MVDSGKVVVGTCCSRCKLQKASGVIWASFELGEMGLFGEDKSCYNVHELNKDLSHTGDWDPS